MTWLNDNFGNIIVILLVAALLYVCAKSVFSKKSGCSSCSSTKCAGCSLCANAQELKNRIIKETI